MPGNWRTSGKRASDSRYRDTDCMEKEKIQNLIAERRTSLAEVSYLNLDFITKVVENFENPKLSMENVIIKR